MSSRGDERGLGTVVVVGTGRLGLSLCLALEQRAPGALVGAVYHSRAGRDRAARLLPRMADDRLWPLTEPESVARADLAVIAVRDDAISEVASRLLLHRPVGQVVVHTSGFETAAVLRDAGLVGPVGSFHPLQTFADPARGPSLLAQCVAACEGDPTAVAAARALARAVGAEPIELPASAKVAYHAAAVMASNYLVVITGLAARLASLGGIDEATAVRMLGPLQRGALENLARLGVADALTGPIARGDVRTVQAHLRVIDADAPELAEVYRGLGRHAVELALRSGADRAGLEAIRLLLLGSADEGG